MKLLVIGAVALASLTATAAAAQTQGPANVGPAIPGVCVYFNQRLLAQSTAGLAVQARMEQLATETQGELAPYATTIETEIQSLQQGGQAADPDGARRTAVQQRIEFKALPLRSFASTEEYLASYWAAPAAEKPKKPARKASSGSTTGAATSDASVRKALVSWW